MNASEDGGRGEQRAHVGLRPGARVDAGLMREDIPAREVWKFGFGDR